MDAGKLFDELYRASTETALDAVLNRYPELAAPQNWRPYGQNESNYGVVENQQASPIPALVEKLINSIDAILMRRCFEEGIDPKSPEAPVSIEAAVQRFFPSAANWSTPSARRRQSESIQIIADGPKLDTSLIIYDDGEGQHPSEFDKTFLSLLRGNKNEIHFVQGKYNMGGAGAIAFCGRKRYQLVASRRFDGTGEFGFTLLRRHPLTPNERTSRKNTWYEYLVIDGKIPSFPITELELGLHGRRFTTGTVIKLYSYDLPVGARSVISRDLNQSLNEYLFSPALPLITIDKPDRYPKDRNLQRDLYGLRRRLEEDGSKYVAEFFSEDLTSKEMGRVKVTCYVFRPRIEEKTAKETKETIQREFFKNDMAVLFSVHGQVHGHFTSEFITRALKFPLLKDYLLVHVDCTDVRLEFRNELFMASRDRLKDGEESRALRRRLADLLADGRLKEIYQDRKSLITVDGNEGEDLLRSFTKGLPLKSDLMRLLGQTFRLPDQKPGTVPTKEEKERADRKKEKEEPVFFPWRVPSIFKIESKASGTPVVKLPLGGQRTIRFATDVEDQFFDRIDDPGELKMIILDGSSAERDGGIAPGLPADPSSVLNIVKSSPHKGTIRVTIKPTAEVKVGDTLKLKAELSGGGAHLEEIFLVKVTDPEKKEEKEGGQEQPANMAGLPKLTLVYEEADQGGVTWPQLEAQGIAIDQNVVMYPLVEGDMLTTIFVNMSSNVLLNHRAKLGTSEAVATAERRYISAIYFHTLFLYMITKNRRFELLRRREGDGLDQPVDVTEYLRDVFQNYYAEFLMNFEVHGLMAALE